MHICSFILFLQLLVCVAVTSSVKHPFIAHHFLGNVLVVLKWFLTAVGAETNTRLCGCVDLSGMSFVVCVLKEVICEEFTHKGH